MMQTSQTSVKNVLLVDSLASKTTKRRYSMQNCRTRVPQARERGEPINVKVTIASVRVVKIKERQL